MTDQCALDTNDNLKDTSEIGFYESETNAKAISAKSTELHRSGRKRQADNFALYLRAEKADNNGNPIVEAPKKSRSTAPRNEEDKNYDDNGNEISGLADVCDSSDNEDSDNGMDIDNEEILSLLHSKTVPGHSRKTETRAKEAGNSAGKRKQVAESAGTPAAKRVNRKAIVEELEDEDDPPRPYFKCYHRNHQIITIPKASRSNLGKLIRHLETNFLVMHRLYVALHMQSQPPIKEQVKLAKGAIPVDSEAAKEYLGKVEMATLSIIKGLEQQAKKARGDFDQALFDTLFAEWMVTCDQPFDEVEKPEFIWLMEYTHHGSTLNFRVPGRKAITTRIMKMGEDTVDGTHKMFQELKPKVSLSCDAWTSSNQHLYQFKYEIYT
ncbi:Transposase-like protein [Favolaschia claudopus]|uniref:Transposase-like protein n=1 Tax=Favolaschia claudopus TaxID=2862362 RepID=A0AAW0DYV0_9AGAR